MPEIVLESGAGEEELLGVFGVIAGDAEDDVIERVGAGGGEGMKEVFSGCDLGKTGVARRKRELTGELIEGVDAEFRHAPRDRVWGPMDRTFYYSIMIGSLKAVKVERLIIGKIGWLRRARGYGA